MTIFNVAQRVVCYGLLFVVLIPNSSIPCWIHVLCIKGTWFDRLTTRLRLAVDWSLFTEISVYYHDIRVTAKANEGSAHVWYLLRDPWIGPVYNRSSLTRTTLTFYYESYPFLNEVFAKRLAEHFQRTGLRLQELEIEFVLFSSYAGDDEFQRSLFPVNSRRIYYKQFA